MLDDLGPASEFIDVPVGSDLDGTYPYHVEVDGRFVMRTRVADKARAVGACVRGRLWRTPVDPRYPAFVLCDFEREAWHARASVRPDE